MQAIVAPADRLKGWDLGPRREESDLQDSREISLHFLENPWQDNVRDSRGEGTKGKQKGTEGKGTEGKQKGTEGKQKGKTGGKWGIIEKDRNRFCGFFPVLVPSSFTLCSVPFRPVPSYPIPTQHPFAGI